MTNIKYTFIFPGEVSL